MRMEAWARRRDRCYPREWRRREVAGASPAPMETMTESCGTPAISAVAAAMDDASLHPTERPCVSCETRTKCDASVDPSCAAVEAHAVAASSAKLMSPAMLMLDWFEFESSSLSVRPTPSPMAAPATRSRTMQDEAMQQVEYPLALAGMVGSDLGASPNPDCPFMGLA